MPAPPRPIGWPEHRVGYSSTQSLGARLTDNPSDQAAGSGDGMPTRRRARDRAAMRRYLKSAAILEIGDVGVPGGILLPREIAVTYPADNRTLAWLVQPELEWKPRVGSGEGRTLVDLHELGRGLPPGMVARQLWIALEDRQVFSSSAAAAQSWLRALFTHVGASVSEFTVHDLFKFLHRFEPLEAEVRDANAAAERVVPRLERAAAEVARSGVFAAAVLTRVSARWKESSGQRPTRRGRNRQSDARSEY